MFRSKRPLRFAAALLAALLVSSAFGCGAQGPYPQKAIDLVVVWGAGGASDISARVIAKHLSAELGQPVNVLNKPGGNQIPAVLSVLQSPPDGYTLLFDQPAASSMQALVKDLPYKLEDRTFGPMMAQGPNAFAVPGKSPWNSLKDVLDAAKKDPASFTYYYSGGAAFTDYVTLQLLVAGGVDLSKAKPVEFASSGDAFTAVAGGHIMLAAGGASAVLPLYKSGDLKPLAVTGAERIAILPDIPSAREAGFPEINLLSWYGISGPKGLPGSVLDRVNAAAKKICADPAFLSDLKAIATESYYMPPDQVRDYVLNKEVGIYTDLTAKLGTLKK